MLIEQVVGNILQQPIAEPIDWLDLTWAECFQRAVRRPTRSGAMVRVLLPLGQNLRHGDVLLRAEPGQSDAIVVNVNPCTVLVARPAYAAVWAQLAYELGSLHMPVQIDADQLITLTDGPVEAIFEKLGVPYTIQEMRFAPTQTAQGQITISEAFALNRRAENGQDPS